MDYKLARDPDTGQVDVVISKGDYVLVEKKEEIIQRVEINLMTFRGEAVGDPEAGTDYHRNIFPYNYDDITLQHEIQNRILSTRGVLSLSSITFEMIDDILTVNADINTEEGEAKLSIEL